MVWGWAASSVFLMFVALAMAELGSAMPMAGGLYYWTYYYSSPKWRRLLSWIVGYTNSGAYISGLAGIDWGCAVQIMAIVSIGSDSTFVPTTGQTFGVYCAILVCHAMIGSLRTKDLAGLQRFFITVNVGLCLAIIIGMPTATPKEFKNPASFALGGFENLYPWPNGFAFVLSFVAPLWVIGGFDSSVHISEEARNANVAVPWAVVCSTFLGCVLGWTINVVLVFFMGNDTVGILSSPIQQPMATILFNSFGKKGTLAIWSFVIAAQFMAGMSIITISSRQNFAFARDGALPGSRFLYRINRYTGTPVNSVWTSAFLAGLLGLLAFAGPAAIGAIFTLGVVAQYVSNSIPIAARFLGGQPFKHGPFNLGRFGLPVGVVAVAWMSFMSVVLMFPTTPQTDATEMNYTVVVIGGVVLIALGWYYLPVHGGVHWFQGPVRNITIPAVTVAESVDEKGDRESASHQSHYDDK